MDSAEPGRLGSGTAAESEMEDPGPASFDEADVEALIKRAQQQQTHKAGKGHNTKKKSNNALEEEAAAAADTSLESACAKMEEMLASASCELDAVKATYLRGRLLELRGDLEQAESLLSRSVKLDPLNARAWNALGELLWRQGKLGPAKDCFTTCMEHCKDKQTVRNLSMLLRSLGNTSQEKASNHVKSLQVAKEAVAMDYGDAESWYVLGNTYLGLFFALSHKRKDLEAALKAYGRSESLLEDGTEPNADMYFNRAQVLTFMEDFGLAVRDYRVARDLDPQLQADARITAILSKTRSAAELVRRKGRVKPKRLSAIVDSFAAAPDAAIKFSRGAGAEPEALETVETLSDLASGPNPGKRMDVKVIMPLGTDPEPPASVLVVDRAGNVFGLSIYHLDSLAQSSIKAERGRITIVEPCIKHVDLEGAQYTIAQLHFPTQFFVNGQSLNSSFAHAALGSQAL